MHGQVVVCPGVNDGAVLDDTLAGVLDQYPELATVAVVPLGVSPLQHRAGDAAAHRRPRRPRSSTPSTTWQDVFRDVLGRRLVFAADEYYLLAGRPFPAAEAYEGFPMHEDGIGMARTFELEFTGAVGDADRRAAGLLRLGRRRPAAGYRAPRNPAGDTACAAAPDGDDLGARRCAGRRCGALAARSAPVGILTGRYGAAGARPARRRLGRDDVRVIPVRNEFFGGNTGSPG